MHFPCAPCRWHCKGVSCWIHCTSDIHRDELQLPHTTAKILPTNKKWLDTRLCHREQATSYHLLSPLVFSCKEILFSNSFSPWVLLDLYLQGTTLTHLFTEASEGIGKRCQLYLLTLFHSAWKQTKALIFKHQVFHPLLRTWNKRVSNVQSHHFILLFWPNECWILFCWTVRRVEIIFSLNKRHQKLAADTHSIAVEVKYFWQGWK